MRDYLIPSEQTTSVRHRAVSSDVLVDFVHLAPQKDAIVRFADTHGWLGFPEWIHSPEVDISKARGADAIQVTEKGPFGPKRRWRSIIEAESFWLWEKEIDDCKAHFKLWEAVATRDTSCLRRLVKWHSKVGVTFRWSDPLGISAISRDDQDFDWRAFRPNSLIEPSKAFLIRRINTKLKGNLIGGVRFAGRKRDPFKVEPFVIATNLLSAIWLQFSDLLTGKKELKACEICGDLMDISECTRRGSKRMHKRCSQNRRTAKYRGRLAR